MSINNTESESLYLGKTQMGCCTTTWNIEWNDLGVSKGTMYPAMLSGLDPSSQTSFRSGQMDYCTVGELLRVTLQDG